MLITKQPTIHTLNVTILEERKADFANWQAKLNGIIIGFEGFISLEFLAQQPSHWVVVERFYDAESLSQWRQSKSCQELLSELKGMSENINEKTDNEANLRTGVTEVIITELNPDKEKAYLEWCAKIHQIEAKFPGFRGIYVQRPKQGSHWITLLQFDTSENLDRWLESKERENVLKESAPLITSLETHRVASPYAGWFYSIAKTEEIPSTVKQTMLVLLVLFPIVMLEVRFLSPITSDLNLALAVFISNTISVTLIAFPMMPLAIGLLGWWLFPRNWQMAILGTVTVFLIYLLEILIFWK